MLRDGGTSGRRTSGFVSGGASGPSPTVFCVFEAVVVATARGIGETRPEFVSLHPWRWRTPRNGERSYRTVSFDTTANSSERAQAPIRKASLGAYPCCFHLGMV